MVHEAEVSGEVLTVPSKIIGALLMSLCNSPFCHTWRWQGGLPHPDWELPTGVVRHEEAHHGEAHGVGVRQEVIPTTISCTTIPLLGTSGRKESSKDQGFKREGKTPETDDHFST
jgi:hypothetical protein